MSEITRLTNVTERDKLIYYNTIIKNPYVHLKPYPKQAIGVILANKEEQQGNVNSLLLGAGGYGGKTVVGSILAVQYLNEPDYTVLITRKNYSELLDTNSIWENLNTWCCGEHLPENIRCNSVKSPTPRITAPNGNTIYFKAFDDASKKQKLKSASYDRIINDEASELDPQILRFQYRSMRNTSRIPRSVIQLSNPGGASTEYIVKEYVDGDKPYIALDWRDNPFIDKEAYSKALDELDYIDQQFQKYGNWHYKPSQGDLISRDELLTTLTPLNHFNNYNVLSSVIGIDLASTGTDYSVATNCVLYSNGKMCLVDYCKVENNYPEEPFYQFIQEQCEKYQTQKVLIEKEPGSASEYGLKHWKNELKDLIYNYGLIVTDIKPSISKFNRARPLAHALRNHTLYINKEMDYEPLFNDLITISPVKEIQRNNKSPDYLDSATYAFNGVNNISKGVTIS